MDALIKMNCIPIINTNDAVAPPPGEDHDLKGVSVLLHNLASFVSDWAFL